jgi:hypothetical protein
MTSRGGGTGWPMALEEVARRGVALTGNGSSAARRMMVVEHGALVATLAARASVTAEEETAVLGSGVESGGDLRGGRR